MKKRVFLAPVEINKEAGDSAGDCLYRQAAENAGPKLLLLLSVPKPTDACWLSCPFPFTAEVVLCRLGQAHCFPGNIIEPQRSQGTW